MMYAFFLKESWDQQLCTKESNIFHSTGVTYQDHNLFLLVHHCKHLSARSYFTKTFQYFLIKISYDTIQVLKGCLQQIIVHLKYFQEVNFLKLVVNMLSSRPLNKLRLHNASAVLLLLLSVCSSVCRSRLLSAVKLDYKDK